MRPVCRAPTHPNGYPLAQTTNTPLAQATNRHLTQDTDIPLAQMQQSERKNPKSMHSMKRSTLQHLLQPLISRVYVEKKRSRRIFLACKYGLSCFKNHHGQGFYVNPKGGLSLYVFSWMIMKCCQFSEQFLSPFLASVSPPSECIVLRG